MNPHAQIKATPFALIHSLFLHRALLFQLARREIISRYRGSFIGFAWAFFNPLLMLVVYTVFFSIIGGTRGQPVGGSYIDFAIVLFVGLVLHGFFADCLNRAPLLIVQNTNYVKKVVFPLEILPVVTVACALFNALIGLLILLVAQLAFHQTLVWTGIFFPLVVLPFLILSIGVTWFLAALGTYLRDIAYVMPVVSSILLFMSPVFYSVASLPSALQPWIHLNPLSFVIEQSRMVLLQGELPDWQGLAIYTAVSLVALYVGFWCFQQMRKGFSDVL